MMDLHCKVETAGKTARRPRFALLDSCLTPTFGAPRSFFEAKVGRSTLGSVSVLFECVVDGYLGRCTTPLTKHHDCEFDEKVLQVVLFIWIKKDFLFFTCMLLAVVIEVVGERKARVSSLVATALCIYIFSSRLPIAITRKACKKLNTHTHDTYSKPHATAWTVKNTKTKKEKKSMVIHEPQAGRRHPTQRPCQR